MVKKKRLRILFIVIFNIALLIVVRYDFISLIFSDNPGDYSLHRYSLDTGKLSENIKSVENLDILGLEYYTKNNEEYISYVTTSFNRIDRNLNSVKIQLHHTNLSTNGSSNVTILEDIVSNTGDRFPYLGLEKIETAHNSTNLFSSVYVKDKKYQYQHIAYNGTIVSSQTILDGKYQYFNLDNFVQYTNSSIGFIAGKDLGDTHITQRHIIKYNLTTHQITDEIVMSTEIFSYNLLDKQGSFIAEYNSNDSVSGSIGKFDNTGKLLKSYGQSKGSILDLISEREIILMIYIDGIFPSVFNYFYAIIIGTFVILVIYQYIKNRRRFPSQYVEEQQNPRYLIEHEERKNE